MSARHKLNSIYITGSIVVSGIIGAIFESWIVFFIAAAVLIGVAMHDGGIRPNRRRRF